MGGGRAKAMSDMDGAKRIPNESKGGFIIEGWLNKRGPLCTNKWKPKWCTLGPSEMHYYEDEAKNSLNGTIEVKRTTRAVDFQNENAPGEAIKHRSTTPFGFVVDEDPTGGKNRHLYYFHSSDQDNLKDWLAAFELAAS